MHESLGFKRFTTSGHYGLTRDKLWSISAQPGDDCRGTVVRIGGSAGQMSTEGSTSRWFRRTAVMSTWAGLSLSTSPSTSAPSSARGTGTLVI